MADLVGWEAADGGDGVLREPAFEVAGRTAPRLTRLVTEVVRRPDEVAPV